MYINGKLTGKNGIGAHDAPFNLLNRKFNYLGKSAWDQDGYFKGAIDDLRVYDRIVSSEEVKCLADVCSEECFSTCEGKSDKCDS